MSGGEGAGEGRPLRLALVGFAGLGGSGVIATELARALAERGHQVHLVSDGQPLRLGAAPAGLRLHVVDGALPPPADQAGVTLALASALVELAGTAGLDLIHAHYGVPHAVAGWLATALIGVDAPPLITTLHGTDVSQLARDARLRPPLAHAVLRSAAVTTPSQALRLQARRLLALPPGLAMEVLPNFVDTDVFRPRPGRPKALLRQLFPDLQRGEVLLCHASNFRPVKRVADTVALLAALLREGFPSRLLLLGDGPDRAAVEAEVARRGLQARVALLGDQADCARWFAAADLFLLPSAEESFGLAAAEALACGTPVLASAVGGLPEVVEHGRSGWLLPVGDVEAACAAALGLLRDRRRLAEAGRQARRRAELLFRRRPAVTAYEALYRRVLAARAGPGHGAA